MSKGDQYDVDGTHAEAPHGPIQAIRGDLLAIRHLLNNNRPLEALRTCNDAIDRLDDHPEPADRHEQTDAADDNTADTSAYIDQELDWETADDAEQVDNTTDGDDQDDRQYTPTERDIIETLADEGELTSGEIQLLTERSEHVYTAISDLTDDGEVLTRDDPDDGRITLYRLPDTAIRKGGEQVDDTSGCDDADTTIESDKSTDEQIDHSSGEVRDYEPPVLYFKSDVAGFFDSERVTVSDTGDRFEMVPGTEPPGPDYSVGSSYIQVGKPGMELLGAVPGDEVGVEHDGDVLVLHPPQEEEDEPDLEEPEVEISVADGGAAVATSDTAASATCQNCGNQVTGNYARVFTPPGMENPRVCPECENKIRTGDNEVRLRRDQGQHLEADADE